MNILLTNDDGYDSHGIQALYAELSRSHQVLIVAPMKEQSGTGMSFSLNREMLLSRKGPDLYALDGTPVDCVKTGIMNNPDIDFDLILSGINLGPNLGTDVNYSGTVAAARQAYFMGYSAISISHNSFNCSGKDYKKEAAVIAAVIEALKENKPALLYNINFPEDYASITGAAPSYLGRRYYQDNIKIQTLSPDDHKISFHSAPPRDSDAPHTDTHLVRNGKISVTPLSLLYGLIPYWWELATENGRSHAIEEYVTGNFSKDRRLTRIIERLNKEFQE